MLGVRLPTDLPKPHVCVFVWLIKCKPTLFSPFNSFLFHFSAPRLSSLSPCHLYGPSPSSPSFLHHPQPNLCQPLLCPHSMLYCFPPLAPPNIPLMKSHLGLHYCWGLVRQYQQRVKAVRPFSSPLYSLSFFISLILDRGRWRPLDPLTTKVTLFRQGLW